MDAEVVRLVRPGAEKVSDGRTWTVLRDPAGLLVGVVPAGSSDLAERSREVCRPTRTDHRQSRVLERCGQPTAQSLIMVPLEASKFSPSASR